VNIHIHIHSYMSVPDFMQLNINYRKHMIHILVSVIILVVTFITCQFLELAIRIRKRQGDLVEF